MNRILSFIFAGAVSLGAFPVSAAEFDFVQLIDGNDAGVSFEGTYADNTTISGNPSEAAFKNFTWTVDGLSVTATATATSTAYAYLDKDTAGLGVCSAGLSSTGNQCDPANDDNVTTGEVLQLQFSETVLINFKDDAFFRDANHGLYTYPRPLLQYMVDGAGWINFGDNMTVDSQATGTTFLFQTTDNSEQFYISLLTANAIPLPSTIALMGLGLLCLRLFRRQSA